MGITEDIQAARLLIVDDQESNVVLLQTILEAAGYRNIDATTDPREVFDLYRRNHYDLILLDLSMPHMSGFEVMEALKPIETGGYLPVLVITAEPEHKLRALQAGAKDFITKPFDQIEVLTRIHNMVEIRLLHRRLRSQNDRLELQVEEQTSDLRAAEAQVGYLLNFDQVTGLPNRILLRDRYRRAQEQLSGRGDQVLGLLLVDLSRLLSVREGLGVKIEQSLLIVIAHRLQEWAGHDDTVARYGDVSFAVVAVRHDPAELAVAAGEILTALDGPFNIDGEALHVEASVGIATCPNDGDDFDALIQAADVSAKRALEAQSGRYQFYTPELNRSASERIKLENALRRALECDELVLHYQPQVDLHSGRIIGMEALVRWQHPELGLVFPGKFIGLAEETGLIVPIGEWVLREACRQNRAWQDAGLPRVPVAVNLSAKQFVRDVTDTVESALKDSGLEAAYLELELTESLSMDDPENTIQILRTLKRMGVILSIDDFGTGYSNLNYLKRFPIDKLKLDQSFVRELICDPDDLAISRAVIAMAHTLRLRVIAEGVETDGQRCVLARNQCDEMQGYLFSRPVEPAVAAQLLREKRTLAPSATPGAPAQILLVGDSGKWDSLAELAGRERALQCLQACSATQAFETLAIHMPVMVIYDPAMDGLAEIAFPVRMQQMYPDVICRLAGDTAAGLQQLDTLAS